MVALKGITHLVKHIKINYIRYWQVPDALRNTLSKSEEIQELLFRSIAIQRYHICHNL